MLEIINSIIGLTIISVLFMYANYTVKSKEYHKLSILTAKVLGDLNYKLKVSARNFWYNFYLLEDQIIGTKTHNIKYF